MNIRRNTALLVAYIFAYLILVFQGEILINSLKDRLAILRFIDFSQMGPIQGEMFLTPENITVYLEVAHTILPFPLPLYLEYAIRRI